MEETLRDTVNVLGGRGGRGGIGWCRISRSMSVQP